MFDIGKGSQSCKSDYVLNFGSGINNSGNVLFTDCILKKEKFINICVDDQEFKYRAKLEFPSVVADLIDLAVSIHTADRLVFQTLRKDQIRIHVILPVRHPEIMNTELFQQQLEDLLEWATGSRWSFDFFKRLDVERFIVNQPSLQIASQDCEVALWSGGLDAFAGLYQRLKLDVKKPFMLFGTGGNVNVHKLQEDTKKHIDLIFPGRCNLYRFPIRFYDSNVDKKNKITRARGIVFAMLGLILPDLVDSLAGLL